MNVCAGLLSSDADAITFDWSQVRFQHVTAIRASLTKVYKPASVNKMLAAVRGALRSAWQSGYMSAEDYHKAASVKSVKGETLPAGRELTGGEISALMADCEHDTTNAGARDAATDRMVNRRRGSRHVRLADRPRSYAWGVVRGCE